MGKTGIISLIFFGIFGILVPLESPYWLYSIPFFVLGMTIPIVKGMWDASGWASGQFDNLTNSVEYKINFKK